MLMQLTTARFLDREAIVDDEPLICERTGVFLEDDYEVVRTCTRNEALPLLAGQSIDVIGFDYHLTRDGAVAVAGRADEIGIPWVWMTGDHAAAETDSRRVLFPHRPGGN
jgi:DNA-binding NarL/FixJ family response regulator